MSNKTTTPGVQRKPRWYKEFDRNFWAGIKFHQPKRKDCGCRECRFRGCR